MATRGGGVYFPVDAGFCDTQAARQVRRRLGDRGFCAYVRLLCMLVREPSGGLRMAWERDGPSGGPLINEDDDSWDVAEQLGMDIQETRTLVWILERYGALVIRADDEKFHSPLVDDAIDARRVAVEKGRRAAEARWNRRKAGESEAEADASADA